VKKIIALWKAGSYSVASGQDAHEAAYLNLDSTKALEELGWKAALSLDEALSMTVEWYKAYYANRGRDEMLKLSVRQISDYSAKARMAWKKVQ
jgi:CDP-glucose 4,6-dehydratase